MEYRDLYDNNRNLTGEKILKGEPIPDGKFYLMVVIFIQNSKKEFLIQKRNIDKGGKWATTGGHPKSGQTSLGGIKEEIKEELGIEIENPILFKQAGGKDTFCDLYYLSKDIDIKSLEIQKEEVDAVKWASISEINNMFKEGTFNKGHYMMLTDCLSFLETKKN